MNSIEFGYVPEAEKAELISTAMERIRRDSKRWSQPVSTDEACAILLCYIADELARRVYAAFQNIPAEKGEEYRQITHALAKAWEWGVLIEKGRESAYDEIDSAVNTIRQLLGFKGSTR